MNNVQKYYDQVKAGEHNRSSVGEYFKPKADGEFQAAIEEVAAANELEYLLQTDESGCVQDGCRYQALHLLSINGDVTPADMQAIILDELRKWEHKERVHLPWLVNGNKPDHSFDLRTIGPNVTEAIVTVRKRFGLEQLSQLVPQSVSTIQSSWERQESNWAPVPGKEKKGDELYYDERLLHIFAGNTDLEVDTLEWTLNHHFPDGKTYPRDFLDLREKE